MVKKSPFFSAAGGGRKISGFWDLQIHDLRRSETEGGSSRKGGSSSLISADMIFASRVSDLETLLYLLFATRSFPVIVSGTQSVKFEGGTIKFHLEDYVLQNSAATGEQYH